MSVNRASKASSSRRATGSQYGLRVIRAAGIAGLLALGGCVAEDTTSSAPAAAPAPVMDATPKLGNPAFPLLGKSKRGGSPQWDYCSYGGPNYTPMPDGTPLPTDPRTLVQPGVGAGKAVAFNAFWKDCHVLPSVLAEEVGHATTCGELRQRFEKGDKLLNTGRVGTGVLFSGTDPWTVEAGLGIATFSADQYNKLWMIWGGFLWRPSNFDQLVAERYGSGFGGGNPYPKPGEDPNKTNGGSGQLPEMFTQIRKADGKWTGQIGVTCHACHTGVANSQPTFGGGNSMQDLNLFLRDMLPLGYVASVASLANLTHTRGTNNASDVNLAFAFPDSITNLWTLPELLGLITSGSTGSMDSPNWWNMGHRPVKFVDGMFPMDAPRVDMVFYTPIAGLFGFASGPLGEAGQDWMRENGPMINTWVDTLKSPAYPQAIDTAKAEQGAALFHELDLWSRPNAVDRPAEGNGSCASCHGAYSPRYVNDTNYLATPALEGVAGYITPQRIIAADPARLDTNNEMMQRAGAKNFFGYPQTYGTDQDCTPQNQQRLRDQMGGRELGYLAPPLYGVWASAPYMHNGSIPNVWEVLKPSDRKPIWRRVSKSKPSGQPFVIMGYDTRMTAYDATKMGWKYDTIPCKWRSILNPSVTPYISCDPNDEYKDPLAQQIASALFGNIAVVWNILFPPILTNQQMEDRKIYNTKLFSQGNEGHEFTSVLTDEERSAIIEYMKTL